MFRNKSQKIMCILIFVLALISGVLSSIYFQGVQENQRERELFINHLYFSIDGSINRINNLIENKDEEESLERYIYELEKQLLEADAIIRYGNMFADENIYNTRFFRQASSFLYGVNMTGAVNAQVSAIGESNQLTENDLTLLNTIKGYLENAKQKMYLDETKQENPNLTIDEINEIIMTDLNNDHVKIYKDALK
ncbi:hypothetical protein GCM10011351_32030 [Paraliobacillus quinghaiensis]|uniref:Uncharacterized protein n=1 Tax=Paraliobacillus quinghaiensis TaxID=470815 RepID=A0A917WZP9_9BACI|nr:hypothetical protein [Paraliobacillus quinghaiensis]GGM43646.1 hypothetical protein GCM10011351_32030 [Paraliobacillus quinghaiensis]